MVAASLYNSSKYPIDAVTPTAEFKGRASANLSLFPNSTQSYNGLLSRQIRDSQCTRSLRYTSQMHPSDIPDEDESIGSSVWFAM
jgi:hypothetical protein